jgi:hypothetical protein
VSHVHVYMVLAIVEFSDNAKSSITAHFAVTPKIRRKPLLSVSSDSLPIAAEHVALEFSVRPAFAV